MGKPIPGNPVLRGSAAEAFRKYLAEAQPDPSKEEQRKADLAFYRRAKVETK